MKYLILCTSFALILTSCGTRSNESIPSVGNETKNTALTQESAVVDNSDTT